MKIINGRVNGMKPASDKQIAFAFLINQVTKISLPEEETAQAYFIYIRDNIDEYKRKKREKIATSRRVLRPYMKKYGSYMDEDDDASWAASMDFDWM